MLDSIKNIILEYADIPKESITADTLLFAELKMDSLEILNMICRIEEEFDIVLSTSDMKNINTVGDLAAYLETQKNGKK